MNKNIILEQTTSGNIDSVPKEQLKAIPKKGNWIAGATKNKGALRIKAKKEKAINKNGKISKQFLKDKSKGNTKLAKQARLALTLAKFNKKDK